MLLPAFVGIQHAQQPAALQVRFGTAGLERVSYRGVLIADTQRWPEDNFHIWHMRCFDEAGKPITTGQYGWGENNSGRHWDQASDMWTYDFAWGSIRVQYLVAGDTLNLHVTSVNRAGSGVVFDGATVYPLAMHLSGESGGGSLADGLEEPAVIERTWADGQVVEVVPKAQAEALYTGFEPGRDGALETVVSGTPPDALPAHDRLRGRPIRPGQTDEYTVSLRFAPPGTPLQALAADAYRSFAERWPPTLHWPDRHLIGTVFLASSGQGDKTHSAGWKTNPRRFFTDPSVDVQSPEGLQRFQQRVLTQAEAVAVNLRRMEAQGVITWDVEGEQFPQDTSYVCAPDRIAEAAPEMESVISSPGPYAGQKLDDAYFHIIREAGFRVGVCVRPQRFVLNAVGTARQQFLPEDKVAEELIRKMRWAHDRWGATIFYLDSTVREGGDTLPAAVLEQAAAAMPDSLLIPEESTLRMYRATAPFQTFLFHGDTGTAASVRAMYPQSFSANLVNDVDPAKLAQHRAELVDSVRAGDVLMVHAGYWQANDPTAMSIYRTATGQKRPAESGAH